MCTFVHGWGRVALCACIWLLVDAGEQFLTCSVLVRPFTVILICLCVYIHGCPLHAQSLNRAVFVMSHENSHIVEQSEQKALGLSWEQRVMTHCVTCTCLCVLWGVFWVGFFFPFGNKRTIEGWVMVQRFGRSLLQRSCKLITQRVWKCGRVCVKTV